MQNVEISWTENSNFCGSCGASKSDAVESTTAVIKGGWSIENLWSGRLARWHYFAGAMLPVLGIFILVSVWGIIHLLQSTFSVSGGSVETAGAGGFLSVALNDIIVLLITVFILAFFLGHIFLAIRRCHDLGYTGWLSLLVYIPYIGFIAALFFIFKKGEEGLNQYGKPPTERPFFKDIFNY